MVGLLCFIVGVAALKFFNNDMEDVGLGFWLMIISIVSIYVSH